MKKLANTSGVYLIVSVFVLLFLNPPMIGVLSEYLEDVTGASASIAFSRIMIFLGPLLFLTGYYLKRRFKNDEVQMTNINSGIRFNAINVIIFLLMCIDIIFSHLD
jgi:hypothetical protein